MMTPYTLNDLKALIGPIARKHGIKRVSVFGSYGRNQAGAQSDVDLHIEKGIEKTLLELIAFQQEVEEALCLPVDIVTSDIRDKAFLAHIKADEVPLYEQ